MSKRTKIILAAALIILIILIAAIIIWKNAKSANVNTKSAEVVVGEIASPFSKGEEGGFDVENNKTPLAPPLERGELSPEEIEEENLKSLAASFVERWGSWSTDGDFSNFESLKAQMTDEMKEYTDEEIKKLRNKEIEGGEFYGITTKALSVSVKEKAESTAVLTVICQKSIDENGTVSVAYDEVELEMVKEGGRWVVSKIN